MVSRWTVMVLSVDNSSRRPNMQQWQCRKLSRRHFLKHIHKQSNKKAETQLSYNLNGKPPKTEENLRR